MRLDEGLTPRPRHVEGRAVTALPFQDEQPLFEQGLSPRFSLNFSCGAESSFICQETVFGGHDLAVSAYGDRCSKKSCEPASSGLDAEVGALEWKACHVLVPAPLAAKYLEYSMLSGYRFEDERQAVLEAMSELTP